MIFQKQGGDQKTGDNEENPNAKIGMQEQQMNPEWMIPRQRMADQNEDNRNGPKAIERGNPVPDLIMIAYQ
jgi:hypothetical protein